MRGDRRPGQSCLRCRPPVQLEIEPFQRLTDQSHAQSDNVFRLIRVALGVLIALVALMILGVIHKYATGGKPLSDTVGSPGLAKLLIIFWLGSGGAFAAWLALRR